MYHVIKNINNLKFSLFINAENHFDIFLLKEIHKIKLKLALKFKLYYI